MLAACGAMSERLQHVLAINTDLDAKRVSDEAALQHVKWMVSELPGMIMDGQIDKAHRWLGFVQGVLWREGLASINDLRAMNTQEV